MSNALIASADQLAERAARWARAPWLALDTEFVRVDTYYPKLCLIQVSDGVGADCVDILALPQPKSLLAVLDDPGIVSVLHAASQDNEILVQLNGRVPSPIFDSQIAATLLGIGDQIGYAALVEKRLGIAVDKSLARTDWSRRPLKENEIAYAADDVRHLAQMYPALREELQQRGRLAWLEEDCARMNDPEQYRTHPQDAWKRLKGMQRLSPQEQSIAAALAAWRESEAQKRDRPRKWILDDEPIYKIAQRAPQNLAQLEALKVLPPKTLERHGKSLVEVVAKALAARGPAVAPVEELTGAQTSQLKKLQAVAQDCAAKLGIPASYLVSRSDLAELLRNGEHADIALLQGWRREAAGEDLLKLVAA
ncbi:MAG TPA: ribonuclease D [Nevskiaceae bacterium]|nr:ribonuclease D [Nevskiaceae bacterium]